MKLGLALGLLVMAVASCGGAPKAPSLDSCLEDGAWSGTGSCGITSFTMAMSSSNPQLSDFGGNAAATFTANAARTQAVAGGLIILSAPNHDCDLSCGNDGWLHMECRNTSGGKCESTFKPVR
jgi:hypothetical protein